MVLKNLARPAFTAAVLLVATGLLASCDIPPSAVDQARSRGYEAARTGDSVERRNYDWRRDMSNDPSTILWCSFAFPNAGMKLVTVPVVGKLSSGGKRSFGYYSEEPDEYGMFGTSDGGYRYGFGPGGKGEYYDFSQLPSFCTNVPLTFQQQQTTIIMEPSRSLLEASNRAKKLIQGGKLSEASKLLKDAIKANAVDPR